MKAEVLKDRRNFRRPRTDAHRAMLEDRREDIRACLFRGAEVNSERGQNKGIASPGGTYYLSSETIVAHIRDSWIASIEDVTRYEGEGWGTQATKERGPENNGVITRKNQELVL